MLSHFIALTRCKCQSSNAREVEKALYAFKDNLPRNSCLQAHPYLFFVLFFSSLKQRTIEVLSNRQEQGSFQNYTRDLLTETAIITYVEKCCRYAWKLVCQTPPYVIEGQHNLATEVFDKAIHQVSREYPSIEHSSGYILCVIWPGLFEGSSRRVIRKTEVILQNP